MTALAVVSDTLAGAYLAPALDRKLAASQLEGSARSLVTELAYGCLRRLLQVDEILSPRLEAPGKLPERVRAALRLGVYELRFRGTPPHAAVSTWVEIVKAEAPGLAKLANAVLRAVARELAKEAEAGERGSGGAAAYSLPDWLWSRFQRALGEDAGAAAAGMLEPEPLWLTAFSEAAEESLLADGCEVRRGPLPPPPPVSLSVRSPLPLARLAAFSAGLVQAQNPSSLFAARLLAAAPGERVLDLASGRGVKSAVLAAAGADVTAVELAPGRAEAAGRNLARLGSSVKQVVADLLAPLPPVLSAGGADKVLLDAPCSGTGTLRGHPEIKLRLTPEAVGELAALQGRLLAVAASLLRPGGTLLYAVCALTPEEGPEVVAAFLAANGDFASLPFDPPLPARRSGPGTYILPTNGLDGFYLAPLARR